MIVDNESNIEFIDFKEEYINDIYAIERDSIDVAWSESQLRDLIGKENVVARVGVLDGTAICSYSFNVVFEEGEINNLSVKKSERGKGIGNLLMKDMINVAKIRNLQSLTLEVNENNEIAINLYKKFGFEVEGRRPNYYFGKDAALIMWRRNFD